MESYTLKKCPRCGVEFKCYNKGKQRCWCENYTLGTEVLRQLQQQYDNCLCEDCLRHFSTKKAT